MPIASETELAAATERLAAADVRLLLGSVVDMSGVVRAKTTTLQGLRAFHGPGLGAAPSWHVFCADNGLAFTPRLGVVGDLRLRLDLAALRPVGDGTAWAPAQFHEQSGEPSPLCTRGLLRRAQASMEAGGLSAAVGCELEFTLTEPDGAPLATRAWNAYGASAILDRSEFVGDLLAACERASLRVSQFHAEYGDGQYELSFAPADPLTAADDVVLARLLIGRSARRHGLAASFSPMPFAGAAGNGAHLHLSLARGGVALLSGGPGPHGLTGDGAAAVAGIVGGLPDFVSVLAGSPVSGRRLQPGRWSGAFACWGLENREAAVRLCAATPGNPGGAHAEVKCADPSANPYLAVAVILALALDGVERRAPLPPEVTVNPSELTAADAERAGVRPLGVGGGQALAAFAGSPLAPRLLGQEIVDALLAVRRHEGAAWRDRDEDALTARFRFAWSV